MNKGGKTVLTNKLDYNEVFQYMQDFGIDFINRHNEMIIDYKTNTYTDLKECENIEDVKMRVVFSLCRPIGKGLELREANMLLKRINDYYSTGLTREDMRLMYQELCYRHKFDEFKSFIKRGFPLKELKGEM